MTLTVGSLFSGIGGLELGLERAGLGPVLWQCEIDPFCRRVLAKHWPTVTRFEDVTRPRNYPHVDVICGGFPCQDVSSAGAKRGIGGHKSSLWWHYADIVRQVRPRHVVVENVASGAKLWLPHVRHQLHMLGYRTRAFGISAADVGAPHLRRRIFVVADAHGLTPRGAERSHRTKGVPAAADANGVHLRKQPGGGRRSRRKGSVLVDVAREDGAASDPNRDSESALPEHGEVAGLRSLASGPPPWATPPEFRGVDDGIPGRVDRLRALGNAVVPQCAEVIGRMMAAQHKSVENKEKT